ncbi:hypothetical protein T071_01325 [Salmonella enterica subsp. enterica]|nr:hypothetical protein [Salmonella enterica subsp. enterica serovar Tennessee]EHM2199134.1 hypothetical protein [Salmonella enterica]QFH73088.1 hypothetical protein FR762_25365 [Enterobacter sp. E76]EBK1870484.1 hypothetical protein [Salmonella enterica subsp. enterica serovar Tennessee]ECM2009311.1 hypothetical protein [Salmonella enterica subsp. enterica serovar Tennessee]
MKQGNIQNFAIIVLVNGSTKQVYLTKEQKQLFAKLTLGTISESPITMMPIDDMIQLQPDTEAFSS